MPPVPPLPPLLNLYARECAVSDGPNLTMDAENGPERGLSVDDEHMLHVVHVRSPTGT